MQQLLFAETMATSSTTTSMGVVWAGVSGFPLCIWTELNEQGEKKRPSWPQSDMIQLVELQNIQNMNGARIDYFPLRGSCTGLPKYQLQC